MNKKNLTEQEIRSRYIRPAIVRAGWGDTEIREEYYLIDYLFVYFNAPLVVVEAKGNRRAEGAGMVQTLRYAEALDAPFAYSANGDGFIGYNRLPAARERFMAAMVAGAKATQEDTR